MVLPLLPIINHYLIIQQISAKMNNIQFEIIKNKKLSGHRLIQRRKPIEFDISDAEVVIITATEQKIIKKEQKIIKYYNIDSNDVDKHDIKFYEQMEDVRFKLALQLRKYEIVQDTQEQEQALNLTQMDLELKDIAKQLELVRRQQLELYRRQNNLIN